MDLRAPLPADYCMSDVDYVAIEPSIQYLLCRMYLASQMMEVGSEARFTSIILFRRYVCRFHKLVHENWLQTQQQQQQQQDQPTNQELKQIKRHLAVVAAACLFLGCKAEEDPRRIRDVINLKSVLDFEHVGDESSTPSTVAEPSLLEQSSTRTEPLVIIESMHPPPLDDNYWSDKDKMVSIEQQLLRMLQFDTLVSNPYRSVLVIMQTLNFGKGARDRNNSSLLSPRQSEALIFKAWTILNEISIDTIHGTTILRHPVVTLACAVISVAAAAANRVNGDNKTLPDEWWRALDVPTTDLTSAVSSINNLIHRTGDT